MMAFLSTCRSASRLAAAALIAAAGVAHAGADQIAQVDQPAPELDVKLLSGKILRARDLRGKVVINLVWATWSPASRMDLPQVQRLYQAYHDKGLEILALAIDESPGDVREFWKSRGYSFPAAMRSDAFFERYGRVSTTPMFYIVDRQGVLRHRIAGTIASEKLEGLLKALLAEPARVAKH